MSPHSYTIEGQPFSLPCHVQEASSGAALFLVPLEAARALMPGPEFSVAEFPHRFAIPPKPRGPAPQRLPQSATQNTAGTIDA